MNQLALLTAEDTGFSLQTLQALHYGAQYSGVTARGILHITFIDPQGNVYAGNVISIEPTGVNVYTEEGEVKDRVPPSQVLFAEVV